MPELITIIVAVFASSGFWLFVQTVYTTRRNKKDETQKKLDELEAKAVKSEKDSVRLQLLVLMSDYPDDTAEILTAAKHYFGELKADWYMTSIFNNYLQAHNIGKPEWFEA